MQMHTSFVLSDLTKDHIFSSGEFDGDAPQKKPKGWKSGEDWNLTPQTSKDNNTKAAALLQRLVLFCQHTEWKIFGLFRTLSLHEFEALFITRQFMSPITSFSWGIFF